MCRVDMRDEGINTSVAEPPRHSLGGFLRVPPPLMDCQITQATSAVTPPLLRSVA